MFTDQKKDLRFNLTTTKSQRDYVKKQARKQNISASEFVREIIELHKREDEDKKLKLAAEALAEEYRKNAELTAFTAIDGDSFL